MDGMVASGVTFVADIFYVYAGNCRLESGVGVTGADFVRTIDGET